MCVLTIQGRSRSSTSSQIERHTISYQWIIVNKARSVLHGFRDIAPWRKLKTTHRSLSPQLRGPLWGTPLNFAVKFIALKVETFSYFQLKTAWPYSFSRFITTHSRYRQTTDRQHIMTLQFFCNSLPVSYLIDETQLMFFFSKLQHANNPILRTMIYLPIV